MFTTRHKLLAAILLAGASLSVQATEASFDGAEEPGNHVVFHAPGADEAGLFAPTGAANDYLFVAGSAFNRRVSSRPSIPGSCTSMRIRSGGVVRIDAIASLASAAVVTS